MKLENFKKLGLSETTLEALRKKGFERPSEIQEKVIPLLLTGEGDVIGQAQTGTGKTAAFGLPLIEKISGEEKDVQAIVLCPTRELAIQVAEEISSFKGEKNIKLATLYGGQSYTNELSKLKRGVQIVVGTPGRVMDHLAKGTLKISKINYFVLDEADEMLNMGFKEDIESILETTPKNKKMLFFSATMPRAILEIAKKFMKDFKIVAVEKKTSTNESIEQLYFQVNRNDKFDALCRIVDIEDNFLGIVFCKTKNDVDELTIHLQNRGYEADGLHGDVKQSTREKIVSKLKSGKITILVATDVAARGIDINNLTHVINYSIPDGSETYTHRIGRTGRAGKTGTAITFVTPAEHKRLFFIQKDTKAEISKGKLPSAKEIQALKRNKIVEKVRSLEDFSGIEDLVQKILEDKDPKEVVSGLVKYFFQKDLESEYREISESKSSGDFGFSNSETRLFIAKGKRDGMTPRLIIDFINEFAKVGSKKIQGISIMDSFTFVTMPFKEAEEVLKKIKDSDNPIIEKAQVNKAGRKGGFDKGNFRKREGGFKRRR